MSLNEEVDLLRNIPLFSNIEPSKLKLLAFTSERLTFPAGQELFHQGDMGDTAYIIIDGKADVTVSTPAGVREGPSATGADAVVSLSSPFSRARYCSSSILSFIAAMSALVAG